MSREVPDLLAALAESIERARLAQGKPPSTYSILQEDTVLQHPADDCLCEDCLRVQQAFSDLAEDRQAERSGP